MTVEAAGVVRSCVLECEPYVAGRPREEVQRLLGTEDVIKLASNENPLGASPMAKEAIRRELDQIHYYPEDACTALRRKLAERWSLGVDQIIVGNGSMQVLELICKTFLNEGEEVLTGVPSFRVFQGLARAAGGYQVAVPLREHRHDLEAMGRAVNAKTKIVIVCNPNNPTGTVVEPGELKDFARSLPSHVVFVLDEAYGEYCEAGVLPDLHGMLEACPNLLVLRSFSKAFGLAGMRVGYAMGSERMVDWLQRARMPFVTTRLSIVAACAALEDQAFLNLARETNRAGVARMEAVLDEMGLEHLPSHANFLAVRVGEDLAFCEAMTRRGVIVFPGSKTDMPGFVRVTVGTPSEVDRFLREARSVLGR